LEDTTTEISSHRVDRVGVSTFDGDETSVAYDAPELHHSFDEGQQEHLGDDAPYEHDEFHVRNEDDASAYENYEGAQIETGMNETEELDFAIGGAHQVEETLLEHEPVGDAGFEYVDPSTTGTHLAGVDLYDEHAVSQEEDHSGVVGEQTDSGDNRTHDTGEEDIQRDEFELAVGTDDASLQSNADSPKAAKRLRADSEAGDARELDDSGESSVGCSQSRQLTDEF
jgi:hypothetical protein